MEQVKFAVAVTPYEKIRSDLLEVLPIAEERKHHREKGMIFQLLGFLDAAEGPNEQTIQRLETGIKLLRSVNQMDDLAWTTAIYALNLVRMKQYEDGKAALIETLNIATELNSMVPVLLALPSAILIDLHQGKLQRALELYGAIRSHPTTGAQPRWWDDVCGHAANAATAGFSSAERETARQAGSQLARDIPGLRNSLLMELSASETG